MTDIEKILAQARAEIGYTEKYNNDTKYGREYGMTGQPWCCMFVWWVFKATGLSELFYGGGKTASCTALMNYAKSKGQWITGGYRAGDIILYQFDNDAYADHVGICENVTGSTVTCIEGNTSKGNSGSQANGDGVYRRVRSTSLVYGAYRPKYKEEVANPIKQPKEDNEMLTYEQFEEYMNRYIKEQREKPGSTWSKEARDWAVNSGLFAGDENGNLMWKSNITREQMATLMMRMMNR